MKAVKLEGGRKRLPVVRAILDAEIPVLGHIGLTPQSFLRFGGFKVQAKSLEEAERLLDEALALEAEGVFAIVLECVPVEAARRVSDALSIPTIGIGAGVGCDGQILVFHDLLGWETGHRSPRFVRRFASLRDEAKKGIEAYAAAVREGSFPSAEESFHLSAEEAEALAKRRRGGGGAE
jgi:3-methyl-2-oxobutanoate hydroxymethyltransferase